MRKTIAVVSTAGALLYGGAAVATADSSHAGVPASTTTAVAQDDYGTNDNGTNGMWGLAGLLGLLGLLGLRHRHGTQDNRAGVTAGTRAHTATTTSAKTAGIHNTGTGSASHNPGSTYGTSTGPSGTATAEPSTPYTPQTYPGTTPPPPTV